MAQPDPYRPAAFILGAGASMPYGFPSGEELVRRIVAHMLHGANQSEVETLFNPEFPEPARLAFGDALMRSGRGSIDTFLEWNSQFAEIGKLAIAHQLIMCENPERVFQPPTDRDNAAWYKFFFNTFLLRGSPEDFVKANLLVLTFNYDRSFEFALFNAIKHSYSLSDHDAHDLLTKGVQILHLHGDLGELLAPDTPPDEQRDFVPVVTPQTVRIAQRRIRVVHDTGPDALALYVTANEALKRFSIACFLGFSYNEVALIDCGRD